jgi:choline dehydrogenase-like flavoprotein
VLLRSGIGPAARLAALGIDVVADLPVGLTLQEHALITVPFPLAGRPAPGPGSATVCLRYSSGLAGAGPNDMMILTGGGYKVQAPGGGPDGAVAGGLRLWVMRAFSNGSLELVSRDPAVHPALDLGLLSDERDLARMVDGLERVSELLEQPAFARILGGRADVPSAADLPLLVGDGYSGHVSSTCPLGRPGDEHAVVGPDCRVLGTDGLRVVDASIMPHAPRANINLSVVMLAEHAAERLVGPSGAAGTPQSRGRDLVGS